MKKLLFLLLAGLLLSNNIHAQRERNYIYLVDCTSSMLGVGPKQLTEKLFKDPNTLYHKTLLYLKEDIERIENPNSMITVIPFNQEPGVPIQFPRSKFNWKEIEKSLEAYTWKGHRTGICKAWDAGVKEIDETKDNYFYLLTDGTENVNKNKNCVSNKIREWCSKFDHTYGFYVALSDEALKDASIKDAVDMCSSITIVNGHQGPFGAFNTDEITINTREMTSKTGQLKSKTLDFSAEGTFSNIDVKCNNENIGVSVRGRQIKNGRMVLDFAKKSNVTDTLYEFDIEITSNPKELQIVNPIIHINVIDKEMRNVDLIADEFDGGKVKYYPKFLFVKAKEPDTIRIDLSAKWNDAAKNEQSICRMSIGSGTLDRKQYKVYYNDNLVHNEIFVIKSTDDSSILRITMDPSVKQGKYFFDLKMIDNKNLETINDNPSKIYENKIRLRNDVQWNPLAKALFIIAIILLTLLIVWFIMLKRLFFPTFRVGRYQITEPYFVSRRLSGVRKVVFCNSRQSQSALSSLFTGKIIYETNDIWNHEWILTPSAKKGARVTGISQYYEIDPYCSTMNVQTDYNIVNLETNQKAKISLF